MIQSADAVYDELEEDEELTDSLTELTVKELDWYDVHETEGISEIETWISITQDSPEARLPRTFRKEYVDLFNSLAYTRQIPRGDACRLLRVLPGPSDAPLRCELVVPQRMTREQGMWWPCYHEKVTERELATYSMEYPKLATELTTRMLSNVSTVDDRSLAKRNLDIPTSAAGEAGYDFTHGAFVTIPMYAFETYTAVTHSRVSSEDFVSIRIGHDHRILVRTGVKSLLCRLRDQTDPRLIWIDCICINQCDVREREYQVANMWRIYNRADEVVGWLGEDDQARISDGKDFNIDFLSSLLADDNSKSWWRRLWVVQETSASQNLVLMHGPHRMGWSQAMELASSISTSVVRRGPNLDMARRMSINRACSALFAINDIRKAVQQMSDTPPITTIREALLLTSDTYCSNKADRVYALLGLLPSAGHWHLEDQTTRNNVPSWLQMPDYAKPVDLLFLQTMVHILTEDHKLDGLVQAWPKQSSLDLSWVLDFSAVPHPRPPLFRTNSYSAGTRYTPDWRLSTRVASGRNDISQSETIDLWYYSRIRFANPLFLEIKAVELDEIHSIAQPQETVTEAKDDAPARGPSKSWVLNQFLDVLQKAHDRHFEEHDPRSRLTQISYPTVPLHCRPNLGLIFACWRAALLHGSSDVHFEIVKEKAASYLAPYESDLKKLLLDRVLFCTRHGLVGIGPQQMRRGDKIVVPFGASVPFVLRPRGQNSWSLIGDAYVEGVMAGELTDLHQQQSHLVPAEYFAIG